MRRMLSTKAGATFSYDCPQFTYAVRKNLVEIISYIPASIHNEAMLSGAWTSIAQ